MAHQDSKPWLNTERAPRRLRDRRRAMFLAEVMVVVAISSILLGVVVTMLIGVRQWDRKFRNHGVHSDQLARLSSSIRADARRAADVTLPSANTLVVTAADKSQTRYELAADGCRRIIKRTVDGPDEQANLYTIGPSQSWTLERGAPGRLPTTIVSLTSPSSDKSVTDVVLLYVCAAVGADLPAPEPASGSSNSKPAPEDFRVE